MKKGGRREINYPAGLGRAMFVSINVLVWVIILCFPFLMATRDGSLVSIDKYLVYSWIPLMFMLVFYFNYYFLIDKLVFEKRNWWLFSLCNVAMVVLVASFSHILQELYLTQFIPDAEEPSERIRLVTWIIRDGLVLTLVIGLSVALKMAMAWREHQNERARLEAEKRDAELQNLRSQLNPHFLFNTLNNIYGLTLSDGEKAREAIHSLSSILRYILYTPDQTVPLDNELGFIRSYVDLMRLRQGAEMSVKMSLPTDTQGVMIAPLMFMTLIENGFKHGVSQDGKPSFVRISITVETDDAGTPKAITCLVENSDFPKTDTDRSGSGIGIGNLARRLALLYPKHHDLTFAHHGGAHTAKLTIKL
jgi:LytS/YehU family sensor histidine kinase